MLPSVLLKKKLATDFLQLLHVTILFLSTSVFHCCIISSNFSVSSLVRPSNPEYLPAVTNLVKSSFDLKMALSTSKKSSSTQSAGILPCHNSLLEFNQLVNSSNL